MSDRRSRLVRAAARVGLLAASLLAVFAVAEISMRLVAEWRARHSTPWAVYDEVLGYRLNPELPDVNEHGLRDRPIGPKGDRFRILMLGDSVAYYGDDVDDTWVGHLRRDLGRDDVDVVNAGVRGYSTYQELLYLERDGLALAPDLVGVGFVLNDLHDFLTVFRVENGKIVGTGWDFSDEALGEIHSPLYRLARRSRFLVWLRRRLAVAIDSVLLSVRGGYSFEVRPDFVTAWQESPWERVEGHLARMKKLGEAHGFRVFVVAFPFGDQYLERYLERDREHVLWPQHRLAEATARLGLPLLDLYRAIDPREDLKTDKIHLTAAGRRHVAREVAAFLGAASLLPPPAGEPTDTGGDP